jgi:hypothetical protein
MDTKHSRKDAPVPVRSQPGRYEYGVLDNPLSMAVIRYLNDCGGESDAHDIRQYVHGLLHKLGWRREAIDAEYRVQMRRMFAIGYIRLVNDGQHRRHRRSADWYSDRFALTKTGRNGVIAGTPNLSVQGARNRPVMVPSRPVATRLGKARRSARSA